MLHKFLFIAFLLMTSIAPACAATSYSEMIEDLPLMPDMTEVPEEAVVFDKPSGRIVETVALTASSGAEISAYYAETLPPLGWAPVGNINVSTQKYHRENETLTLRLIERDGKTHVHFILSPE